MTPRQQGSPGSMQATAIAHPNIALAKYWGKRPDGHNLPAVPSLSVTLAGMTTTTTVRFEEGLDVDDLVLGGAQAAPAALERARGLLDRVRAAAGLCLHARVSSDNDFPTAAGLASSASGFAALALAASAAAGLPTPADAISDLARRTSVSAARSAFGGFCELAAGREGQEVLAAAPVAPAAHWPLRIVVAVTSEGPKDVSSTSGMQRTAETSPYHAAWIADAPAIFAQVKAAVLSRDLPALGEAAEASALRMHAAAMAAAPGIVYWTGATVEVARAVRRLRQRGVDAWFTIDAGPHVKVITTPELEAEVTRSVAAVPGVLRTLSTAPGEGARLAG